MNDADGLRGMTRQSLLYRTAGAVAAAAVPALGVAGPAFARPRSETSATAAPVPQGTIDFFGFEGDDFSSSKTLKQFLAKTGARIQSDFFPGAPVPAIIQRTHSGRAKGVDIVDAFTLFVPVLDESGGIGTYFQPIDPAKVPNLKRLIAPLRGTNQPWAVDGRLYAVPVSVSPNSPVWARKRVNPTITKWTDLLDPRFKGRLGFIAFPEINYSLAVNLLKLNPKSHQAYMPKTRLQDAIDLLKKVRANAKVVSPSNGDSINALNAGEIDVIWGGFPGIAVLANKAKPQTEAVFTIFPRDGNINTIQGWAIGAQSDNVDSAYAALNEALDPRVQGEYNNFIVQGPAVQGVDRFLKPSLRAAYSSRNIGRLLTRFQLAVEPPIKSSKYVTAAEWETAFAKVTS